MSTHLLPPALSKSKQEEYLNRMFIHREKSILTFLSSPTIAIEHANLLVENKDRQVLSNHQRTWYGKIKKSGAISSNLQRQVAQISENVAEGEYTHELGELFTQFNPTIDIVSHQFSFFDLPIDSPWMNEMRASVSSYENLKNRLVERNQRLVKSIINDHVWKLDKTYLDEDDLMQSGRIALANSISRYNPNEGTFSTFAYKGITDGIKRDLANCGRNMRIPVEIVENVQKYNQLPSPENKSKLNDSQLASELGITLTQLNRTIQASKLRVTSLDKELDESGTSQYNFISTKDDWFDDFLKADSYALIPQILVDAKLTKRQTDVLSLRFGLAPYDTKHTYEEIGKAQNVSHQAIQKAEKTALLKIQETLLMSARKDYFP